MTSLRSLALVWGFAVTILLVLLVPSTSAQEGGFTSCWEMFDSDNAKIAGYQRIVTVDIDVMEKTPEKDKIYTLTWGPTCVETPEVIDPIFTNYFTVNDTEPCTWVLSVNTALTGVPDYNPDSVDTIQTDVSFSFKDDPDAPFDTCTVTLTHKILDENTQKPKPDSQTYSLTIKEDFPPHYTIDGFVTTVHDEDRDRPNNEFTATITDPNCPLEATEPSYSSGHNAVSVVYRLNKGLDYEAFIDVPPQIDCQVTFKDKGTPPLSRKATITITVDDVPDEPPAFSEDFYYIEVQSVLIPAGPLPVEPSDIAAHDGDTKINETITYTMTDVQEGVDGTTYFAINSKTGKVTMVKELDEVFLLNERVLFFVKAWEDTSGELSVAVLEVQLPWQYLVCGGLHFEQAQYIAQIFYPSEGLVLRVHAIASSMEEKEYSLSEPNEHFDIDPNTGWIAVNKDNKPMEGIYQFEARATIKIAPLEQATTQVNILVVPGALVIENSVARSSVKEGEDEQDVTTFRLSQTVRNMCIIAADPLDTHDSFKLEKQDGKNWKLIKTGSLDHERTQEVTLAVQAFNENVTCPEVNKEIPSELKRSQAVAIVSVTDTNDEKPVFNIEDLVVAYPTNEALRRAVGPVVSVQAKDEDSTQVKYSITGNDADKFTVDEETGEVYVVNSLDCGEDCSFSIKASDGVNDDQLNVKVIPLGMDHVFTLLMNATTVSEVDNSLNQLSQGVGVQISKLYVTPTQPTQRRVTRDAGDGTVRVQVHIYSIKEGTLMTLDALNSAIGEYSEAPLQAEKFKEAEVFEGPSDDNTGLTVAVAVLGSLLGLVLIAGIGFFVYQKKRPGKGGAPKQPRSPSPINTLGNAYQNHSYEKDGYGTQGSLGHKTNNSLNGFTSVQVHSSQEGDSPPMHRSPLALPSDNIPLGNLNQGGLRRTNPSAPQYYGSSTPAPPPSFTRTTASSPPEPSSSSSSFPIYAEVKKPKSAASTSISSSRPEKSAPPSTDKQPAVPNADYEEIDKSKFSALKASPPPRRSNRHNADDDDDDEDVSGGVAYPGGKNTKFADDPDSTQEEKKSVAFKVMVDTKEIEAQNMGPAQKKAEAEKLMEANRKKLQDDNDEEDEDDEQSAKL